MSLHYFEGGRKKEYKCHTHSNATRGLNFIINQDLQNGLKNVRGNQEYAQKIIHDLVYPERFNHCVDSELSQILEGYSLAQILQLRDEVTLVRDAVVYVLDRYKLEIMKMLLQKYNSQDTLDTIKKEVFGESAVQAESKLENIVRVTTREVDAYMSVLNVVQGVKNVVEIVEQKYENYLSIDKDKKAYLHQQVSVDDVKEKMQETLEYVNENAKEIEEWLQEKYSKGAEGLDEVLAMEEVLVYPKQFQRLWISISDQNQHSFFEDNPYYKLDEILQSIYGYVLPLVHNRRDIDALNIPKHQRTAYETTEKHISSAVDSIVDNFSTTVMINVKNGIKSILKISKKNLRKNKGRNNMEMQYLNRNLFFELASQLCAEFRSELSSQERGEALKKMLEYPSR